MRERQRGFSMLETALVVLLVGSAIAVAFLVVRMREPARQVQAQDRALQWADQALLAYAARNARLPCAVATPTSGQGDCVAPGQKGWLPVHDLQAVHPGGDGPTRPLRYMVYGGAADSDLALASNRFNPHAWDGTEHDFTAINGLDLCAALSQAAAAGARGDRARTNAIDGSLVNVAYGLSAAGPTPGDGGKLHDGLNAQSGAVMEPPSRGVDSRYDDRVRVRSFEALARSLGCTGAPVDYKLALASLDLLALSVDISDEVDEQHDGNKEDTQLAVVMAGISVGFATINVALAAAGISNSTTTLATASAQLATAIGTCVVLVGCALIPQYTAAVISGGVSIGLATAAAVLAATALGLSSDALVKTIKARDMARTPIPHGPTDLKEMIERACLFSDGGMTRYTYDDLGNKVELDHEIFKEGLKQEVEHVKDDIEEIKSNIADAQARLNDIRDEETGIVLFDYDHDKPVHGKNESEEDFKKRYDKWLAEQPDKIKEWEKQFAAKLLAIEDAEYARQDYLLALQAKKDAASQLSRMQTSITHLQGDVLACTASPPATPDGILRCDNARNSLAGLVDCDSPYTAVIEKKDAGYFVRQCLADLTADNAKAIKEEQQAYTHYHDLQWEAFWKEAPPLIDYIHSPACGTFFYGCNALIVPLQDFEHDDRETYAATFYKSLELKNLLELKQKELEDKEAAYQQAHAQCLALQAMKPGSGGATPPPVWSGPAAILKASDCRGATGPVVPLSCEAPTP